MDSPNPTHNPNSISTVSAFNQSNADLIISSLISFPDSSPFSVGSSFDRVLDKALASASSDGSVQDRLVDRTVEVASLLLESTKRCFRKRASSHNSNSWFLPPELTVKVFSMLDTKSLMQAAASCTMFNNCAMDRLSYAHIDLTTASKQADNGVLCTIIHRAGKELRSLKVGSVTRPAAGSDSSSPSLLTGSCLSPLSYNHGFLGSRLRNLQLYNIRPVNYSSLNDVLSFCSNITDLSIVGLCTPLMIIFKSLATKCRLIEHLCLETFGFRGTVETKASAPLLEFVTNCHNLTSLSLIRFGLSDETVRNVVKDACKLKYLNLSGSSTIKGRFLRDLGLSCKNSLLKTLILRNCSSLEEKEVLQFCDSLLNGDFKSIRHIDVSSKRGLVSNGRKRSSKPNFPLEKLKEERPGVTFVADFPITSLEKHSRLCDEVDEEELRLIEMMEVEDDHEDDSGSGSEDGMEEEDDSDESAYLL